MRCVCEIVDAAGTTHEFWHNHRMPKGTEKDKRCYIGCIDYYIIFENLGEFLTHSSMRIFYIYCLHISYLIYI